jgi:hypothetical protein
MPGIFAPAAWAVVRITDGRREVLAVLPSTAEARRIADGSENVLIIFRSERRPPQYDPDF